MQRSVPSFVKPGFVVLGHRNPVGLLRAVMPVKNFESMRALFASIAKQVAEERPDSKIKSGKPPKAVSVTSYPEFQDLYVEMDLSPEGWEVLYLRDLVGQRTLKAIEDKTQVPLDSWLHDINDAFWESGFAPRWTLGEADLRQCGGDWIRFLIAPSLATVRLPHRSVGPQQKRGPIKAVRPAGQWASVEKDLTRK